MALRWLIEENLSERTTFRIGGIPKYMAVAENAEDVTEASFWARANGLQVFPMGEGSNVLFGDKLDSFLILKIESTGLTKEDVSGWTFVYVDAGVLLDDLVAWSVGNNLRGIESLTLIPGTVGATPVQNVGAYGQDISQTLVFVEVYDFEKQKRIQMKKKECLFGYRTSIFKKNPGRFIILSVCLRLEKSSQSKVVYPHLQVALTDQGISFPSVGDVRSAVKKLRTEKLPDWTKFPNAGSFFENPVVPDTVAQNILAEHPDCPVNQLKGGFSKLPAGWLIEASGLKGKKIGAIRVSDKNALILINEGAKSLAEVLEAQGLIVDAVKEKFNIRLEREPVVVGE